MFLIRTCSFHTKGCASQCLKFNTHKYKILPHNKLSNYSDNISKKKELKSNMGIRQITGTGVRYPVRWLHCLHTVFWKVDNRLFIAVRTGKMSKGLLKYMYLWKCLLGIPRQIPKNSPHKNSFLNPLSLSFFFVILSKIMTLKLPMYPMAYTMLSSAIPKKLYFICNPKSYDLGYAVSGLSICQYQCLQSFDLYKVLCSYLVCTFLGWSTFRWQQWWTLYDLDPVTPVAGLYSTNA